MSETLKPCPFCGAADSRLVQAFTRATEEFAFWSVECLDCGAEIADDESQEAANSHWNRRATAPQPEASDVVEAASKAYAQAEGDLRLRQASKPPSPQPVRS